MIGIGTLIGGAASAIGSIWGASQSASAARKARQAQMDALNKAEIRNDNNYNYQMGLPRYSATTLLDQTAEAIRRRNEARRGAQKVVGGTQASLQAGAEQDLNTLGTVAQNAIAQGLDDRKRASEAHTNRAIQIDEQRGAVEAGYEQQKAQNIATAVQGLTQTAGMVAAGLDGNGKGKKNETPAQQVSQRVSRMQSVGIQPTSKGMQVVESHSFNDALNDARNGQLKELKGIKL